LGMSAQVWWARTALARRQDHKGRKLENKETRHWVEAIERTCATFKKVAPTTQPWFQLDREGDGAHVLSTLDRCGHWYTVRSNHDRRVHDDDRNRRPRYLRKELSKAIVRGAYALNVPAGPNRRARTAHMVVRWLKVTLRMLDKATGKTWPVTLTAVWTREVGTTPRGETPLNWTLLTNHPVDNLADALRVIDGYAFRWRVEELHRTWKSGACNIEQSQLRKKDHVVKWATLMVAVAARIERLKFLARNEPELPASCELTPFEIKALVLVRRRTKKRTDPLPGDSPTIGEAVRWLADIGGYTGPKVSGGPPGAVTIRRGLDYVRPIAHALEQLESEGKLR
jgi:Transposase DDE domain